MEYAVVDANIRRFYFFVGRATPPHSGHIQVIQETIKLARAGRTCALILLGDGPAGGLRTRANPIEHDTKADFIRHRLGLQNYREGVDYIIQKREHPVTQVVEHVHATSFPDTVRQISITQVAGNKDDDATKLTWIREGSCEILKELFPLIDVTDGGVKAIDPITSETDSVVVMSATKVRDKAVDCYNQTKSHESAFTCWTREFPFYLKGDGTSELSKELFNQIIQYKDVVGTKRPRPVPDNKASRHGSSVRPTISKPTPTPKSNRRSLRNRRGGSRRKHTRRRFSKLRNNKTLRTNNRDRRIRRRS
jgi:hypothetical protein